MVAMASPTAWLQRGSGQYPPHATSRFRKLFSGAYAHHDIRIAGYTVEQKRHAKEVAKSSYFPSIRNDSSFMHVTDTQLIQSSPVVSHRRGTRSTADAIIKGGKTLRPANPTHPALDHAAELKQANDVPKPR